MASKIRYAKVAAVAIVELLAAVISAAPGEKEMSAATPRWKHTNRLINESSPYLLQHAHNPVDWYPWGTEAFERAKKENKPVFLSIGYSTCHWCHVMENESFENERIARVMNNNFVCIKVDREQRPDVDQIYMDAVVLTTGSGGWPLSVFLTPDGEPFFGGTYFPPKDAFGRPGFERVLLSVAEAWRDRRRELVSSAGKLSELLQRAGTPKKKAGLSPDVLKKAFEQLQSIFDPINGGFGAAPKFPQAVNLSMLLGYWHRTGEAHALHMVEKTLDAMAFGGINDHLGGGFHRYSTDAQWLVPHFEKMLYDQALLSKAYLQAFQAAGNRRYAKTATQILDYVLRDMTDSEGGFYSAEDADSEGEEGTFYLWEPEQIASILDRDEAKVFNAHFGLTERGNFEKGKTILSIVTPTKELAKEFGINHTKVADILTRARTKAFTARAKRQRPHRDDKVITGWNGLMISSLAYGGMILKNDRYTEAARRSADLILRRLHKDDRLKRYYRDGHVAGEAFLDDYAFMVIGLMDLYEATFDARWLREAAKLSEEMIEFFADTEQGGFFLAGKNGEKLIARTKPASDGAIPSGNSAAAFALLKLGRLTMNQDFIDHGVSVLETFSQQLEQSPAYSSLMLEALSLWLGPAREIVIAGGAEAEDTKQVLDVVRSRFMPETVVIFHASGQAGSAIEAVVPFVKNQVATEGKATAYVCENYACKKPVHDVQQLERLLDETYEKLDD
jgi:uncharacterized protein YyaL (SSP411 family)